MLCSLYNNLDKSTSNYRSSSSFLLAYQDRDLWYVSVLVLLLLILKELLKPSRSLLLGLLLERLLHDRYLLRRDEFLQGLLKLHAVLHSDELDVPQLHPGLLEMEEGEPRVFLDVDVRLLKRLRHLPK